MTVGTGTGPVAEQGPAIEPLPPHALPPDLAAALERGCATRMLSTTVPVRIWAHRPELARGWLALLEEMHNRSTLDDRLRELVRLKVASATRCPACQVARKSDAVSEADIACLEWSDPRFSAAEQAALHFVHLFASDHFAVTEEHYENLRRYFSIEQIVELNMFAALMLAGGRMTYVQRAYLPDQISPA